MYFRVSDRKPIINIRAKSARRSGLWIALREVYGATNDGAVGSTKLAMC